MIQMVLLTSVFSVATVSIVEPVDGETYDGDWLPLRVIVENENEIPDSVHYALNGSPVIQIPRLNTDWPTYMQNYQNYGYSLAPGPQTSEVFWSIPICGDVHEFPTPVVVDGTVFYPQDNNGMGDSLYAINSVTGEILWSVRVGYTDDTVTYANGNLYSCSDSMFCIDAESGLKQWKFHPGGEFDLSGTPIVTGESVYFAATIEFDSTIVFSADASTGELIWQKGFPGYFASSFGWVNGVLYMPLFTLALSPGYDESLYALDPVDGSVIWSNDHVYEGYWDTSPCLHDEYLYIGGRDEYLHCFNSSDGSLVWETAVHPYAYSFGIEPTPALNNGSLFIGCSFWGDPYGFVGAFSSQSGEELWSWVDRMELHGSFGLSHDLAYIGANLEDSIYAFDQATGEIVWSFGFNGAKWDGCQSSPSITDGIMYIPATDGNLYAFGTGMKYTYLSDLFAQIGSNELIVSCFDGGSPVAADTISFTVTQNGISTESSRRFGLSVSPNPTNGSALISFELEESGSVSVRVFDLLGREVSNLVDNDLVSGAHSIQWNGHGSTGQPLTSGLYVCRVESGGVIETTGLCVLK